MSTNTYLKLLFTCIFLAMLFYTGLASLHQAVQDWTGLTAGPDRYWTIATFMDAYFGFITFYVWVFFKERRWPARLCWFVAIMLLGNMAMSGYVLWQLKKLRPGEPPAAILSARNP